MTASLNLWCIIPKTARNNSIFKLALENWQQKYDPENLTPKLYQLLASTVSQRTNLKDARKYLKDLRKAGLMLKSAQRLTDKQRDLPENFDAFLKQLGKVNDSWKFDEFTENIKTLLGITQKGLELKPFGPLSVEESTNRIKFIIKKINTYLDEIKLDITDYHRLRKYLRHIMNLFQLKAALDPKQLPVIQTFQYLRDLSSDLGDIHDNVVHSHLMGQKNYHQSTVELPHKLKERITAFVRALEKSTN